MEDGTASSLPTKQDEEFRPFIRRLPEFKFWHSATRAIAISLVSSFVPFFDVPVFWPVLVMYWIILFVLTSTFLLLTKFASVASPSLTYLCSAETNPAHDQVPLRAVLVRQGPLRQQEQLVSQPARPALSPWSRQLIRNNPNPTSRFSTISILSTNDLEITAYSGRRERNNAERLHPVSRPCSPSSSHHKPNIEMRAGPSSHAASSHTTLHHYHQTPGQEAKPRVFQYVLCSGNDCVFFPLRLLNSC